MERFRFDRVTADVLWHTKCLYIGLADGCVAVHVERDARLTTRPPDGPSGVASAMTSGLSACSYLREAKHAALSAQAMACAIGCVIAEARRARFVALFGPSDTAQATCNTRPVLMVPLVIRLRASKSQIQQRMHHQSEPAECQAPFVAISLHCLLGAVMKTRRSPRREQILARPSTLVRG